MKISGLDRIVLISFLAGVTAQANGIYRDGAGARSMGLGGAEVASPSEPLEAIHSNPAGLGLLESGRGEAQLGFMSALPEGEFKNSVNPHGDLRSGFGALPEAAVGYRFKDIPLALGFGVIPNSALNADWRYIDAPGGLGGSTTYGEQRHLSQIAVVRTGLAASLELSEKWFVGAGLGVDYVRNRLQAPYIFQSHPVLQGAKTLLDLQSEGWGVNGLVGLLYRPTSEVSIGLSYQSPTSLSSHGDASGNVGVQFQDLGGPFASAQPDFRYDAEVEQKFPQIVSMGVSWQLHRRVRTVAQIDWLNWSSAFDDLKIHLTHGSNPDINGVLGTGSLDDTVPLKWKDRFVLRTGLEFQACESIALRAGYVFGNTPVPASTVTPLTAVINEHTLTAGIGYKRGRYSVDLAYQYQLPSTVSVGTSDLKSGEYSNSSIHVDIHLLALTAGLAF